MKICGAFVDGYCEKTLTIYQYHGCYFHGCKNCFPNQSTHNKKLDQDMGDLYQRTLDRSNLSNLNGYNVVEQWECQWLKSVQYTENDFSEIVPLNPRNAYFGKEVY